MSDPTHKYIDAINMTAYESVQKYKRMTPMEKAVKISTLVDAKKVPESSLLEISELAFHLANDLRELS